MARTLTAGVAPPRRALPNDPQQHQVIAMIFSCICQLFVLGDRWAALEPRRRKLDVQLDAHGVSTDPRYLAALNRHLRWSAELEGIEGIAAGLRRNLAKHYGALTEKNRCSLVANDGWSQAIDPEQLAAEMWARAKQGGPLPGGECPSERPRLSQLRAWAEQCAREYANRCGNS